MAENIKDNGKEKALELAGLVYDIFKERQENDGRIASGQNNANHDQENK